MNKSLKLNTTEISIQIQTKLLQLLEEGFFSPSNKLPPEEELSKSLGVSRAALREVLANLEQEGYIIRRKKYGTFVNQRVVNLKTRLDIEVEFMEMLKKAGYTKADIGFSKVSLINDNDFIAESLGGKAGDPLYRIERLILGDGHPVIFCEDYFRKDLIKKDDYEEDLGKLSLFEFLQEYCGKEISFNISKLIAGISNEKIKDHFKLGENEAILTIEEIGYDINQDPISFSYENYNQKYLDFYLFKKKY